MRHFQQNMGSRAKLNTSSFLLMAPFSTDSILITCDLNLDMRFVLILNNKHVRTAGLTVRISWRLFRTIILVISSKGIRRPLYWFSACYHDLPEVYSFPPIKKYFYYGNFLIVLCKDALCLEAVIRDSLMYFWGTSRSLLFLHLRKGEVSSWGEKWYFLNNFLVEVATTDSQCEVLAGVCNQCLYSLPHMRYNI